MAKYTMYHPQSFIEMDGKEMWVAPYTSSPLYEMSYVTMILMTELKKELWNMGHEADIAFVPLYDKFHRLKIDDIGLDVLDESPLAQGLWFIIANRDTNKFCVIDLQDDPGITTAISRWAPDNLVMSFASMFSMERYRESPLDLTKLVPFVFMSYYPLMIENMVAEISAYRRSQKELDNRLLFYGNTRDIYSYDGSPIREVANVLKNKYPDEVDIGGWTEKLPLDEFLRKAARHKINLALPGHPWCSREHELWTLGLPVMMYEHTHAMAVDLVPNWHYIAVPGGERKAIGMAKDPEYAADQIIKYHRKWIQPEYEWRLNNIAINGQRRIRRQVNAFDIIPKLVELLQLGNW